MSGGRHILAAIVAATQPLMTSNVLCLLSNSRATRAQFLICNTVVTGAINILASQPILLDSIHIRVPSPSISRQAYGEITAMEAIPVTITGIITVQGMSTERRLGMILMVAKLQYRNHRDTPNNRTMFSNEMNAIKVYVGEPLTPICNMGINRVEVDTSRAAVQAAVTRVLNQGRCPAFPQSHRNTSNSRVDKEIKAADLAWVSPLLLQRPMLQCLLVRLLCNPLPIPQSMSRL
jgi:hypothetical protein